MAIGSDYKPFFSIVIPTYNRALQLAAGLQSILAQNFTNYEIIVVDDGSTDETKLTMDEIVRINPCVKYFYKENEERSIARNYGIMKASGKYIGFLDSDDVVYPNHLSVAFNLLERNNFPEVGHLGYKFIKETGEEILVRNQFDQTFKETLIHENILHGNAIFIRRDIASTIHFIPSRYAILSEDWYLWLRLASRYTFHFDNTVTSAVIQHDARSLMNIKPDKLIANTEVIVHFLKQDEMFLQAYKHKTAYHFANHYTFLTLILALTKSRRLETMRYLIKAIRYDPKVVFRRRFLASIKHLLKP